MSYDEAKSDLESAGASMRCSDVIGLLESLGFVVRDCRRGRHKTFKHPSIPSFHGSNFNCGHGRNPEVKSSDLRTILRVMDEYETEIKEHLNSAS